MYVLKNIFMGCIYQVATNIQLRCENQHHKVNLKLKKITVTYT